MAAHTYEVVSVPPECTAYAVGQEVQRNTAEPPPVTIIVTGEGPCNGTELSLVE